MLKNSYCIMRHGESEANEARLIVSSPELGTTGYGLTERGRDSVRIAAMESPLAGKITAIYSSDFLRARETAEIVSGITGVTRVTYTPLLRERFFGDLDMTDDGNYSLAWEGDTDNPDNAEYGVESPGQVVWRIRELINECEFAETGGTLLLVSHGDTLQITQALFQGIPVNRHRDLHHLENGELRELAPVEDFEL